MEGGQEAPVETARTLTGVNRNQTVPNTAGTATAATIHRQPSAGEVQGIAEEQGHGGTGTPGGNIAWKGTETDRKAGMVGQEIIDKDGEKSKDKLIRWSEGRESQISARTDNEQMSDPNQ